MVLVLITLISVIITAIHFILNNKVSNYVIFSCTDKEKIKKPKEELVLSAEDGKYHLCLHGSLLLFQWPLFANEDFFFLTTNYIVFLDLVDLSMAGKLLQNSVVVFIVKESIYVLLYL